MKIEEGTEEKGGGKGNQLLIILLEQHPLSLLQHKVTYCKPKFVVLVERCLFVCKFTIE